MADDPLAMNVRPRLRHHQEPAVRGLRKGAAMPRSISSASRVLIGVTSTRCDGAMAYTTANKLVSAPWGPEGPQHVYIKGAWCGLVYYTLDDYPFVDRRHGGRVITFAAPSDHGNAM